MTNHLNGNNSLEMQSKLNQFKEYAVLHHHLAQVDKLLMRAIREPAGFAHVLVYGPSGVGKTTMIRQIAKRLNEDLPEYLANASNSLSYRNGNQTSMPLLLLETRPPDGGVFNRADYYRTALKLLGEAFYERRMLVDIDSEQTWSKKGRSRSKTAQFNISHVICIRMNKTAKIFNLHYWLF
jgi:Cdc6-like AAA superfamily ATPase